jgi:capsular exopolysaccharide synthesis family protein
MGDVFDAMNRAKREREKNPPAPQGGEQAVGPIAHEGADDLKPALPMDQIQARPAVQDEAAPVRMSAPGVKQRTVADAVEKADAERAAARATTQTPLVAVGSVGVNASLNGYAEQVIVHHDRGSLITEQYRAIRTQILARGRNRRVQIHTITSSAPEEGKSVTTLNLGMAFSELRNQKTLLIEGDLRKPAFAKLLNRESAPGLLHLLRGEIDELDKAIHPTVYDNLYYIPAGDRDTTGSTELLSSPRMAQILDRLRDRYDHIFIDTPPVITVTDATILGALSDETLMVVRLNRTPAEVVDRAKRILRAANCEVAGVILTHQQITAPKYLYRYA